MNGRCLNRAEAGLDWCDATPQVTLDFLGELSSVAEQMVETDPSGMAPGSAFSCVDSEAGLRKFLQTYHSQVLVSRELPIICHAYKHASRNELRELLFLDEALAREPGFEPFANASRNVGAAQLRRLRPLRDQRVVQRYIDAVESGEARGWHTIVYGLILALYALPLRQGLLNYGRETMRGFIASANSSVKLLEEQCQQLHHEICLHLPPAIESILAEYALVAV